MRSFKDIIEHSWTFEDEAHFQLPWPTLNEALRGGLRKRHLTILAGRPGMGKTIFMTNLATHLAAWTHKVGVFSLEQPDYEILDNVCKCYSGGDTRPEHLKEALTELNLWIDDSVGIDANYIKNATIENEFDIIMIDYLQKIEPLPETATFSENLQLTQTLKKLTSIWDKNDCNIFLLSQLSRGPENRLQKAREWPGNRTENEIIQVAVPMPGDLRGSGSIEQDANEILFIHRPDKYREYPLMDGHTQLKIAKQRGGTESTIDLLFTPEQCRYDDGDA